MCCIGAHDCTAMQLGAALGKTWLTLMVNPAHHPCGMQKLDGGFTHVGTAVRMLVTFWWIEWVVWLLRRSAPAAKPIVLDPINGSTSCASPHSKESASRGTRIASPALMAVADKESLWPESMTKKYLAGVRALVNAAARRRLHARGWADSGDGEKNETVPLTHAAGSKNHVWRKSPAPMIELSTGAKSHEISPSTSSWQASTHNQTGNPPHNHHGSHMAADGVDCGAWNNAAC